MATHNDIVVFSRDDLDLIVEFAGCSLDEKPGSNWVQSAGGLPDYICRIARAIKKSGKSTSQAIAIAVSRVKKWAAGGDDVDADTRAKAAKAVAEWEKLKGKSKAKDVKASNSNADTLCLSKSFNVDMVRRAWQDKVSEARRAYFKANPSGPYEDRPLSYSYVKEQWSDYLIVASDYDTKGVLYKVGYSVTDDDVTFSDPVPVKTQYVTIKSDDMTGSEISDKALLSMVERIGPCHGTATNQVLLSIGSRPSALEQVLAAARPTGS